MERTGERNDKAWKKTDKTYRRRYVEDIFQIVNLLSFFKKILVGVAHKCMIWFVIWIVTILVSASVVLVYQKFSFLASMPSVVWLGFFVYLRQVCICVFGQINRYVQVCINYNRCHVSISKICQQTFDMLLYLIHLL